VYDTVILVKVAVKVYCIDGGPELLVAGGGHGLYTLLLENK
jgi:hypothetical protein